MCYFFGRYADTNNSARFGESYEWFFKNLKNANDTISLRPFIDLISEALDHALTEDKTDTPILPQYFYTFGQTRSKAVENHFHDLASEKVMKIWNQYSSISVIKHPFITNVKN